MPFGGPYCALGGDPWWPCIQLLHKESVLLRFILSFSSSRAALSKAASSFFLSLGRVVGGRFVSRGMGIGNSSKPHLYQTGKLHGNLTRESPWKPQMECLRIPPWSVHIPTGTPTGHTHGESSWGRQISMGNTRGNPMVILTGYGELPRVEEFPVGTMRRDPGIGWN